MTLIEKVHQLCKWIKFHNKEPRRGSDNKKEKQLAALLANLRTSKKHFITSGKNGKPLLWDNKFIHIAKTNQLRPDLFDGSITFYKKNRKHLLSILEDISANGEKGDAKYSVWMSVIRNAKIKKIPPWDERLNNFLTKYNERANKFGIEPVRSNLLTVSYSDHHTEQKLKGIVGRILKRKEKGINRINPRNHVHRIAVAKGIHLSPIQQKVLIREEKDAHFINALRQQKQKGIPIPDNYTNIINNAGLTKLLEWNGGR